MDDSVVVLSEEEDDGPSGRDFNSRNTDVDNDSDKSVVFSSSEDDEDESFDEDNSESECDDKADKPISNSYKTGIASTSADLKVETKAKEEDDDDEYSDWDENYDVITIKDSDEEEAEEKKKNSKLWDSNEKMVCMRCPDLKVGTFKDRKKYLFHIKRHVFGEHFSCPTCKRPFIKLTYCVSHEIRVHGAQIDYYNKNPVVKFAKEYVRKKALKPAPVIDLDEDENSETSKMEDDKGWETDDEDVKFYENRVICSNAFMRYQGPDVDHWIECYEIAFHRAGKKYRDRRARTVAKLALDKHRSNVSFSQDTFRLGKFSKNKEKPPAIVRKLPCEIEEEEENERQRALKSSTSENLPASAVSGEVTRPPEEDDGPQVNRKKRKVVWIESSSSEDDTTIDVDYCPSKSKKKQRLGEPYAKKRTSGSPISNMVINPNFNSAFKPRQVQKQKLINRRSTGYIQPKKVLPALIERVCQRCPYQWKTQEDLRVHRDVMHPNTPIIDLIAVPNFDGVLVPSLPLRRRDKSEDDSSSDDLFKAVIRKVKKKRKIDRQVQRPSLYTSPPDATFTEKEKFLHSLGVVQTLRLQLHEKTPLKDLKLKECSVVLKRLTPEEIFVYSSPFAYSHFLLG